MTVRQLSLDLSHRPAVGRSDFLMTSANAHAVTLIDRWPDWPDRVLVLAGPEGSGKSHLACVWKQVAQAVRVESRGLGQILTCGVRSAIIIEDVHQWPEEHEKALLHLINLVRQEEGWLLLTGRGAPPAWPARLPDLASRLRAAPCALLEPPDDALLEAVLDKLLRDRQLAVSPGLVHYLARRMERSLAAAGQIVEALDQMSLADGRPVTMGLARTVLARIAGEGEGVVLGKTGASYSYEGNGHE